MNVCDSLSVDTVKAKFFQFNESISLINQIFLKLDFFKISTISVDSVEHGNYPLSECCGQFIIFLVLTNIFDRTLELLHSNIAILQSDLCIDELIKLIIYVEMYVMCVHWWTSVKLKLILTLLRSAMSEIWSHSSLIIIEYWMKLKYSKLNLIILDFLSKDKRYLLSFQTPLPSRTVNLTARQSKSCLFRKPLLSRS